MINIVIPMAGRGSRFSKVGYTLPKPLIDVLGNPMIQIVTKNVTPKHMGFRFIYLCLEEHIEKYALYKVFDSFNVDYEIVPVKEVTQGAACTVLLAKALIDNDTPLMIVNSDQYVDTDINEYLKHLVGDGLIMTMKADDKKWSFVKIENEKVKLVREKEVISNEATVGIYNFRKGSDFVKYAQQMIDKNVRVNNEFYVAPVYNEMILDNKVINYYNIGDVENTMYGLGTPEDLNFFLNNVPQSFINKE